MQHAAISRAEQDEWLAELMQTYGDDILRLCYVILQDRALAEDASQEVFLKAYKRLHTLASANMPRRGSSPSPSTPVGINCAPRGCAIRTEAFRLRICRPPPAILPSRTTAFCAR